MNLITIHPLDNKQPERLYNYNLLFNNHPQGSKPDLIDLWHGVHFLLKKPFLINLYLLDS